jgi:hypothetical protein
VAEVIIEWVIKRVVPTRNFPTFTKTNYFEWAALMRVMLQARGLRTALTEGDVE